MLNKDAYATGVLAAFASWVGILLIGVILALFNSGLAGIAVLWGGFFQIVPAGVLILNFHLKLMARAKRACIITSAIMFSLTGICTAAFTAAFHVGGR